MSEKPPGNEAPKSEGTAAGSDLKERDLADPVRGPIVRLAKKVFFEAYKAAFAEDTEAFYEEFRALQDSFTKQFSDPREARRYRLYHYIVGSTPEKNSDFFDAEGEGAVSIAEAVRALAKKHGINGDAL